MVNLGGHVYGEWLVAVIFENDRSEPSLVLLDDRPPLYYLCCLLFHRNCDRYGLQLSFFRWKDFCTLNEFKV